MPADPDVSMSFRVVFARCLAVIVGSGAAGCAPTVLEAPLVPNPVLIGPIDRVGGRGKAQTRTVGKIKAETSDFVAVSQDETRTGNTVVVTRTTTFISEGSALVTQKVLERTEGRPDRDVRVDELPVGAWAFFLGGSAMASRWAGLEGRVVEVRHGR